MTAHTNNPDPRPEPRHADQELYAEFYDDDAAETAAWLDGAEWARDPEQIEADNAAGACVCGANETCLFCRAPMCCGPEKAGCDAADHCTDCERECSLCRREKRR